VARQWLKEFIQDTQGIKTDTCPFIILKQDNLGTQNTTPYRIECIAEDIFLLNTPENCTDCVQLIDHELGRRFKNYIYEEFWDDYSSSPERLKFFTEDIKEREWRILITRWAGEAWDKLKSESEIIERCAKSVGLYNCRCGCENHLIKVRHILYDPPKENDPKMEPLTKEQARRLFKLDKQTRQEERQQKRLARKLERRRRRKRKRKQQMKKKK